MRQDMRVRPPAEKSRRELLLKERAVTAELWPASSLQAPFC